MSAAPAFSGYGTTESVDLASKGSGRTEPLAGRVKAWKNDRPSHTPHISPSIDDNDDGVQFEPVRAQGVPGMKASQEDQWARATVIKIAPESVTCEVEVGEKYWEVSLPPILFDGEVRYGTPVRIGVREINGYRTPVVEILAVEPRQDSEIERLREQLLAL